MIAETQTVLRQALRLDAVERAGLIEALFRSLDKGGEPGVDSRWAEEAEARIDAYDAGLIQADSAEAVFRRIGRQ